MKDVVAKAAVLIEALPYIQRFRGETVVVKFGGSLMDDEAVCRSILQDAALMEAVGLRPVIVHGGGKAISRRMQERGLVPRFVRGLRVTDEPSMRVVEEVLNGEINAAVVQTLASFGCRALGLAGQRVFSVVKRTETDPKTGAVADWGYVGRVTAVDEGPVRDCLEGQSVPVLTPLGRGPEGAVYNVNADESAAALARALHARKLVFLSDVPGLLARPDDPSSLLSHVELGQVDELIRRGVITGGMLPKIGGAVEALRAGVRKVHLIDAALPHSLLLELFTDQGVGTELVP